MHPHVGSRPIILDSSDFPRKRIFPLGLVPQSRTLLTLPTNLPSPCNDIPTTSKSPSPPKTISLVGLRLKTSGPFHFSRSSVRRQRHRVNPSSRVFATLPLGTSSPHRYPPPLYISSTCLLCNFYYLDPKNDNLYPQCLYLSLF